MGGWIEIQGDDPRIPPGQPLSFTLHTTTAEQRQRTAELLAASLAHCGVRMETQLWEAGDFFAEDPATPLYGARFDLALFASLTDETPPCDQWLSTNTSNFGGYRNPAYDQACQSALSLLPGQPAYVERQLKTQEIFARDLPAIPLYFHLKLAVTRPDMCGFLLDPTATSEM